MMTNKDIVNDVMHTLNMIQAESLTKSSFNYTIAANQLNVEPKLLKEVLQSNFESIHVMEAMAHLPSKSAHPLLNRDNRTPFLETLVLLSSSEE